MDQKVHDEQVAIVRLLTSKKPDNTYPVIKASELEAISSSWPDHLSFLIKELSMKIIRNEAGTLYQVKEADQSSKEAPEAPSPAPAGKGQEAGPGPGQPLRDGAPTGQPSPAAPAVSSKEIGWRAELGYGILRVKNFRISSSGSRTKITAVPLDDSDADIAVKFARSCSKDSDIVIITLKRAQISPEPGDQAKYAPEDDQSQEDVLTASEPSIGPPSRGHLEIDPDNPCSAVFVNDETGERIHIQDERPIDPRGGTAEIIAEHTEEEKKKPKTKAELEAEIIDTEGLPADLIESSLGMMQNPSGEKPDRPI